MRKGLRNGESLYYLRGRAIIFAIHFQIEDRDRRAGIHGGGTGDPCNDGTAASGAGSGEAAAAATGPANPRQCSSADDESA